MSDNVVIDVRNVSLGYKVYEKPSQVFVEAAFGRVQHDRFWALRDISLTVREGQRLGLIGPNGAGKSSLLQLINGNLSPTSGQITVNGKISSLLSMTPAWAGEETGIENIKINLLLQGVAKSRLPALIEEIIDFTNLGAFIYQPVKTYSSGMSSRLAFAIATAIDPEILIVDEVLGTGDGYFAARATKRMHEMCARGKALLFVSHSTAAVRMLCDSCAWMENGVIRMLGGVDEVLSAYEADMLKEDIELNREGNKARKAALEHLAPPDELTDDGLFHVRLRPVSAPAIRSTYHVRKVAVTVGGQTREADMTSGGGEDAPLRLDLFSCEWGRFFERRGEQTRTLVPRAGTRKGGHLRFSTDGTPAVPRDDQRSEDLFEDIVVEFEYEKEKNAEPLSADILDLGASSWRPMEIESTAGKGGWTSVRAVARGRLPAHAEVEIAQEVSREAHRKPVEIVDIGVFVGGQRKMSVSEFEPFTIKVVCNHLEAVPRVSVNVGLWRSDGVQVWWSPSGYLDRNIENHLGQSTVEFHFDPNPFGFGRYSIHVYAVNGFAWDNCPSTEIFDQSLGDSQLQINLARPIQFGLLNIDPSVTTTTPPLPVERQDLAEQDS